MERCTDDTLVDVSYRPTPACRVAFSSMRPSRQFKSAIDEGGVLELTMASMGVESVIVKENPLQAAKSARCHTRGGNRGEVGEMRQIRWIFSAADANRVSTSRIRNPAKTSET